MLSLLLPFALTGCLGVFATLTFTTPDGWTRGSPSSSMRVAELTLPRAAGDAEDGSLVVYFFGGSGGTVQANLDRWIGQMTQPDGRPTRDVAKTRTLKVNGLAVTVVDVPGTYVAEVSPGSTERHHKSGFRLRAAVVETPGGPYFIKLVGPAATIAKWDVAFEAFLQSLRYAPMPAANSPESRGPGAVGSFHAGARPCA